MRNKDPVQVLPKAYHTINICVEFQGCLKDRDILLADVLDDAFAIYPPSTEPDTEYVVEGVEQFDSLGAFFFFYNELFYLAQYIQETFAHQIDPVFVNVDWGVQMARSLLRAISGATPL